MESLDEASGFLRTSDEARFQSCERALQQVMHILQRLALVWKVRSSPSLSHAYKALRLMLRRSPLAAGHDADGAVHVARRAHQRGPSARA